jgi:NhaP-type Na+/H+ or K+/H+ antiporter
MSKRFAAAMSLVVFAVCLVVGIQAENSFGTTIQRALLAMAGTMVVGLIVGGMAQKMLDENIGAQEQKDKSSTETPASDR